MINFLIKSGLFLGLILASSVIYSQTNTYNNMLNTLVKKSVPPIKIAEANKKSNVEYFLDTRLKNEFDISHIKNAQWVGYEEFSLEKVKSIPLNAKIIVYCSVGYRSEKIGEKLQIAGYKNVRNLWGGIFQWVNEGLPVYNSEGPTPKVHAYSRPWGIWLKKGEKVY